MKPEESPRKRIDDLLESSGWKIQDYENLNLGAGNGVAVCEYPLKTGFADYRKSPSARNLGSRNSGEPAISTGTIQQHN